MTIIIILIIMINFMEPSRRGHGESGLAGEGHVTNNNDNYIIVIIMIIIVIIIFMDPSRRGHGGSRLAREATRPKIIKII